MLGLISSCEYCGQNQKWQLLSSERESLLQTPFSDSSRRPPRSKRRCWQLHKSCIEVVWISRALDRRPRRRRATRHEIQKTESKNSHSIKCTFQSKVFGFVSKPLARDLKHGYHRPLQRALRLRSVGRQKFKRAIHLSAVRAELGNVVNRGMHRAREPLRAITVTSDGNRPKIRRPSCLNQYYNEDTRWDYSSNKLLFYPYQRPNHCYLSVHMFHESHCTPVVHL